VIGRPDIEHWVLLEDDEVYTIGAARHTTGLTDLAKPPNVLTDKQREAVQLLFADVLAWPPRVATRFRDPVAADGAVRVKALKEVARSLSVTTEGVQKRLVEVRAKAERLGLAREVPLTDPEYVYLLARSGHLKPNDTDVDEELRG
jgi:hypothetical protein